jgi:membrane-bound ClpP family serine protease
VSLRSPALAAGAIGLILLIIGFAADSNAAGAVGSALLVIAVVLFVADFLLGRRRRQSL